MFDKVAATYPPLNTLKPAAPEVWVVDGPLIEFGMPWPRMPFPTRMTILRLRGDKLFVHSPTPLVQSLREALGELGKVHWIIGPNRIHYWWIPEWRDAYAEAEIHLAPRVWEQAKGRLNFSGHEMEGPEGYPWDDELKTLPVAGSFMTEVVFFHPASRTLILTDLVESFEPKKLSPLQRWLTRLGGVQHPDGQMPRDMRLTYGRQKQQLREAVETIVGVGAGAGNSCPRPMARGEWHRRTAAGFPLAARLVEPAPVCILRLLRNASMLARLPLGSQSLDGSRSDCRQ